MNKDNAKDFLPLVQALADGKTIQVFYFGCWKDAPSEMCFNERKENYRIKPEPRIFIAYVLTHKGSTIMTNLLPATSDSRWEQITVQEVLP